EPRRLRDLREDQTGARPAHRRARQDWGTGPTGQRLGGSSEGPSAAAASAASATSAERRLQALEAAQKRQVAPGISKARANELSEQREKEELLGRITEQYHRLGEEVPMGLKLATLEQLRKHLEICRQRRAK
ncbi:unnamed protein product, partial [Effrenium voratum]